MSAIITPIIAQAAQTSTVSGGVIVLTAIAVAIPIIIIFVYLRVDYKRHKRPLVMIDPSVRYTFWHHVKVVTIPLFSYRIKFMIQKRDN